MAAAVAPTREVRLALVLNGGVSLAVWIGGVTHEIDAARLASSAGPHEGTRALYARLLELLDESLVVDVISGASAGGINGVLLASAIYNGRPLPALRDVWLEIGSFERLLRPLPARRPRSLLDGDGVVLATLDPILRRLFEHPAARTRRALYLYVSTTDLFGFPQGFADSTGRAFYEREHRRICTFQHEPGDEWRAPPGPEALGVVRSPTRFTDPDAASLLAGAARSSSSFPVAFETHPLRFEDGPGEFTGPRAMVDGGVLDNQPFAPVLDRIAVLPAHRPVRRVLAYVVPYVTERDDASSPAPAEGTALDTLAASGGLPRDLPRLQNLDRLTRELVELATDASARRRMRTTLPADALAQAAAGLFQTYRWTRYAAAARVHELWADPDFRPGNGPFGNDPTQPPRFRPDAQSGAGPARAGRLAPSRAWIPDELEWTAGADAWHWGLPAGERAAARALLLLRDAAEAGGADEHLVQRARSSASRLLWTVRRAEAEVRRAFQATPSDGTPDDRARAAYDACAAGLHSLQRGFAMLDARIARANGMRSGPEAVPRVAELLQLEVVRHALVTDDLGVSFPFAFLFASAGIENALGHPSATPAAKLAGMKLDHFGGFLKSSWRANDWLWGRLDGVEHVLRAVLDLDRLADRAAEDRDLPAKLGALAQPLAVPGLRDPVAAVAAAADLSRPRVQRNEALDAYRTALAARIQLAVLREDLPVVAREARRDLEAGSSPFAGSASWWRRVATGDGSPKELSDAELLAAFHALRVGAETLRAEALTPRTALVAGHATRLAAAVFGGDGGGAPRLPRKLAEVAAAPLVVGALVAPALLAPWRAVLRLVLRIRLLRAA